MSDNIFQIGLPIRTRVEPQDNKMRKLASWVLLFAVYFSFIAPTSLTANAQVLGKAMDQKLKDRPPGLTFRLSNGAEGAETRVKQPLASTEPISDGDSSNILKRLPQIKSDPDDQTEFAKRIGTLPAPKNGKQLPVKFPAADQMWHGRIVDNSKHVARSDKIFTRRRDSACS